MRAADIARTITARLHEPALVTALQLASHTVAVVLGMVLIGTEPVGVTKVLGTTLTYATGAALIFGGATGAAACYAGAWWLERVGLIGAITGYMMLAPVVIVTQPMAAALRVLFAMSMLIAVLDALKRYHSIRWAYLDPAPPRG